MADLADSGRAVAEGGLVDWVLREYQDAIVTHSEAMSTVVYTSTRERDCAYKHKRKKNEDEKRARFYPGQFCADRTVSRDHAKRSTVRGRATSHHAS